MLVCRINGRLGNTVFLTPLVRRIHELLPRASIDLAMAYPQAADIFENFPGVRRVIAFPHKGPGLIRRYIHALRSMRAERYDLVIDPIAESTSGRIAVTLCRARHRVGFATASQWAPLTHAIPEPDHSRHQAIAPVFLFCRAVGKPHSPSDVRLSLCLRPEEIEVGRSVMSRAIERRIAHRPWQQPTSTRAFPFFAHATGPKIVERLWWLQFWNTFLELEPDAIPVEILPAPASAVVNVNFPTIHCPSPRALTAAIASTRMFISADTGPMHLASSTPVPTVALFRGSDPALYGPLKPTDLSVNVDNSTPRLIAQRCQRVWRQSTVSAPQLAPEENQGSLQVVPTL